MKFKTIAITLLVCVGIAVFVLLSKPSQGNNVETEKSVAETTDTITISETSVYTLKEYNGKLAVFEANEESPVEVYSIFVNTLPKADRDMLKSGISVNTKAELLRLIEDYTG